VIVVATRTWRIAKDVMSASRALHRILAALLLFSVAACGSLLPRSEAETNGVWTSFEQIQRTFDEIVLHQTTGDDLKRLRLDPLSNPNITILNYSDVLRRFIPSPTISVEDLDRGVKECVEARSSCRGYEINLRSMHRTRYGNFWADFFNFRRKVEVVGWHFNGVILLKDNVVIYKLSGGEPAIHEHEENRNPLGPLQGMGGDALR
jgi:hypothetical protein